LSVQRGTLLVLASAVLLVGSLGVARLAEGPAGAPVAPLVGAPSPLPSGAAPSLRLVDAPGFGCSFPDPGAGHFGAFRPVRAAFRGDVTARLLVPEGALDEGGGFDLLVHFHGAEAARRVLVPTNATVVVLAVDAGVRSSAYESLFGEARAFESMVRAVESEVALATGRFDASAKGLALSAWSAGYGAVKGLLRSRGPEGIGAFVLLDGLHAGVDERGAPLLPDLAPFVDLARRATGRSGEPGPTFVITHSEVATEGYASTTETTAALLSALGERELPVDPGDTREGAIIGVYEEGQLAVRAYSGGGREAHCAELALLGDVVREHVLPALVRAHAPP
jgi:hypothetical protein